MLEIQENVNIKNYSTLKVGGLFRYFVIIKSIEEIKYLYSIIQSDIRYKNIPLFILGGGSNIVFSEGILDIMALKIEIKGFDVVGNTDIYTDIKVGAGENWDMFVEKSVNMNLVGLESLSLIPGTVGASPVQNIGAYGSEVKDTIVDVEVFDIKTGDILHLSNTDCKFEYRDSIFKNEAKGKYLIISVTYRLTKSFPSVPNYPGVFKYFEDREINNPTLKEIRDAIIYIRKEKLPDPREIPNTGSFFKNPIVENSIAQKIKEEFPEAKFFPLDNNYTKVPAGWLIENSGLKGKNFGNVSVYAKNALVLINNSNAKFEDIILARNEIVRIVKNRFGVELEQEPEII